MPTGKSLVLWVSVGLLMMVVSLVAGSYLINQRQEQQWRDRYNKTVISNSEQAEQRANSRATEVCAFYSAYATFSNLETPVSISYATSIPISTDQVDIPSAAKTATVIIMQATQCIIEIESGTPANPSSCTQFISSMPAMCNSGQQ